jgi:hypothetical protein
MRKPEPTRQLSPDLLLSRRRCLRFRSAAKTTVDEERHSRAERSHRWRVEEVGTRLGIVGRSDKQHRCDSGGADDEDASATQHLPVDRAHDQDGSNEKSRSDRPQNKRLPDHQTDVQGFVPEDRRDHAGDDERSDRHQHHADQTRERVKLSSKRHLASMTDEQASLGAGARDLSENRSR